MLLLDVFVNLGNTAAKDAGLSIINYIEIATGLFALSSGIFGIIVWRRREKYLFSLNRMAAIKDKMIEHTIELYRKCYMIVCHIQEYIHEYTMFTYMSKDYGKSSTENIDKAISYNKELKGIIDENGAFISTEILISLEYLTANISVFLYYIRDNMGNSIPEKEHKLFEDMLETCEAESIMTKEMIKNELGFRESKKAMKRLKKMDKRSWKEEGEIFQ